MNDSPISARPDQTGPTSLIIIGRNSLQTRVFAKVLEQHLGAPCLLTSNELLSDQCQLEGSLALIDIESIPQSEIEACLGGIHQDVQTMAIFNATQGVPMEWLVRWPKLRGVFFSGTTEDQFVRGVSALRENEYWLPRRMLADYLEKTRNTHTTGEFTACSLTRKEIEILRAIVSGSSNSRIAQQLHISPHTVKTHIYNLYRKIKVRNRVQAASWASVHLSLLAA